MWPLLHRFPARRTEIGPSRHILRSLDFIPRAAQMRATFASAIEHALADHPEERELPLEVRTRARRPRCAALVVRSEPSRCAMGRSAWTGIRSARSTAQHAAFIVPRTMFMNEIHVRAGRGQG